MVDKSLYDEFSMFHENAEEYGIPFESPTVRRVQADLGDGRHLSALLWGTGAPEYVFLHGGAQNAHTWDTVMLALGRPALAIDLPGHGHSDGGRSGYLNPDDNADDVALAIAALAPDAKVVVGMSLGGITTIALVHRHPDLVRKMVLVDVTPGVNREKASTITAFINGPESFPDFDAILARTVEFNPTRTVASLRRGILHNAVQQDDGTWVWRYARHRLAAKGESGQPVDPHEQFNRLWDAVSAVSVPLMLVRGMRPQSVVDDDDEAELRRRQPTARIEHIEEAGHSVQGDTPVELADLIRDFAG
ncbi:MAG TPA: alpha/beta hydrolase [Acidimicrobiales bacterium]|jgi:pimeloyl-ACP methyl ester carboxylesterase|nr:alpha/beta hydrolase [Acidimicrobiales bacterium]